MAITQYSEWVFMKSRRKTFLIGCAVMSLAAWHGFYREEQRIETGRSAPPLKTALKRIFVRPEAPLARLDELRRQGGRLGMSPEVKAECWQVVRGLNEEQVKTYLAEIPYSDEQETDDTVRAMLYSRWAQIDPIAAADRVVEGTGDAEKRFSVRGIRVVLTTWLKKDPEAAIQWAAGRKDDFIVSRFASILIGQLWLREDVTTVVDKARAQAPFALAGIADALCRSAGSGEVTRQQLFSLIGDPDVSKRSKMLIESAGRNWAWIDPMGALKSEDHYGMDDEKYAVFRNSIYSAAIDAQPLKVLDQVAASTGEPGMEKNLSEAFRRVAIRNPELATQAADWATQNNRPDLLAEAVAGQGSSVVAPNPWGPDLSERMETLTINLRAWNKLDPTAAAKWLADLPAATRSQLSISSSDGVR